MVHASLSLTAWSSDSTGKLLIACIQANGQPDGSFHRFEALGNIVPNRTRQVGMSDRLCTQHS